MVMEVSITKMSTNGQVVIPVEIRRSAGITPKAKFLVFNRDGTILLRQLRKETLKDSLRLLEKIHASEEQIKEGKATKANPKMSDEKIDDLLMG